MWKRVVNSKNQLFYISLNEMALLHLLQSEEEEEVLTNSPQWVEIFFEVSLSQNSSICLLWKVYKTLSDSDATLIPKENCPNDPKTIAWQLISTGFLSYKLTEKNFQYKLTDFFFSSNWIFFSVLMDISKNQWRSTGGLIMSTEFDKKYFRLTLWLHWSQKWYRFFHETC